MEQPRVLVVEDDAELRKLLSRALAEEGFDVTAARSGGEALRIEPSAVDVVVLDVGLPDSDGRDICRALRARGSAAPVLFLTAYDSVTDRLAGFTAGGDDYVIKPFHVAELVARLHALLRRTGVDGSAQLADLVLDPVSHGATGARGHVALTPTEFRLLAALVARPGEVVRRRTLVESAWPAGAVVHDNTLDQYIARLRRKLASVSETSSIGTVHRVGYRLS
jgi:two-component system response regulator MprA